MSHVEGVEYENFEFMRDDRELEKKETVEIWRL